MTAGATASRPLRRILGLGFGLSVAFGGTVGVGILALPGKLAAALGDSHLIVLFWVLGAAYAALGAVAIAELSAMLPLAGGFYVYARRAFGNGPGFVIGWSDWLNNVSSIAYACLAATTFLSALWPTAAIYPRVASLAMLLLFTGFHWIGHKISSTLTGVISLSVGLMMLALVAACMFSAPASGPSEPLLTGSAVTLPLISIAMLAVVVTALRAVLVTFDGWYSPIYFAEENATPASTMPRAIIGGTLLVAALYVVINVALLRVLPLSVMAHSELPAADAARAVLPSGGATLLTIISLFTVLSLVNACLLLTPRILLALGRDGLFTAKAAQVSVGGTPQVALALTSATAALLIVAGTFDQILALAAMLFLLNYVSAYAAVFVLRRREPATPRPYRAFGFPITTGIVFVGSVAFLVAAVVSDHRSGAIAGSFVAACGLFYWLTWRGRQAPRGTR